MNGEGGRIPITLSYILWSCLYFLTLPISYIGVLNIVQYNIYYNLKEGTIILYCYGLRHINTLDQSQRAPRHDILLLSLLFSIRNIKKYEYLPILQQLD